MPGKKTKPITSEAQRGLMGAELRRRRQGRKGRMKGMSTADLERKLHGSKGKSLPARSTILGR